MVAGDALQVARGGPNGGDIPMIPPEARRGQVREELWGQPLVQGLFGVLLGVACACGLYVDVWV